MRTYLFHFSYSADALRSMIGNPEDRKAAAAAAAESLGGKLTGFWFAFGEYDGNGDGRPVYLVSASQSVCAR